MIKRIDEGITYVRKGIIIVHCNAAGMMMSGSARCLRLKYPEIFDEYKDALWAFEKERSEIIGKFAVKEVAKGLRVCMCFAQMNISKYDTDTQPDAYRRIFRKVRRQLELQRAITDDESTVELHIPDNLGNEGSTKFEDDILPVIEEEFSKSKIPVFIHPCY